LNTSTEWSDVFAFLARGRNSNSIRKRLSLATGTVKTHISHIYQKTNVSSQQQLMDLIEQELEKNSSHR
jgi:DNA-binding NarL/FixJ family response regulator